MRLRNLTHKTVTEDRIPYGCVRPRTVTYERTRRWWRFTCDMAARLVILGLIIGVGWGFIALVNWGENTSCHHKADAMQVEHRWGFFAGCIVRADDTQPWFPLDQYRAEVNQ